MTGMTILQFPLLFSLCALVLGVALWQTRRSHTAERQGLGAGSDRPDLPARRLIVPILLAIILIPIFAFPLLLARSSGQDGAAGGESLPGIYTRYQGHIYMNIPFQGYYRVPGADAGSFGLLGGWDSQNLGKDKNAVYCGSQAIPRLRPDQVRFVRNSYVSDGSRAWYCTREKDNTSYHWWQDFTRSGDEDSPEKPRPRDYVLVRLGPVKAAALKIVIEAYAQDGEHAFYEGALMPAADGASLHPVELGWGEFAGRSDGLYARDGRHVYFEGKRLADAHPATFAALEPDGDSWNTRYGLDAATGRFYIGAQPFPSKVDGVDSTSLHLLIADRDRANHELFYNASGIWYWDYQDGALKRGCANPFSATDISHAAPTALAPGVWADERNAFVLRAIDEWRHAKGDQSLSARKTQLWMLPGLDRSKWHKVADLTGKGDSAMGTLWQADSRLYFASATGQSYFFNDALYIVRDLGGLRRDLMDEAHYPGVLKARDIERLDSSDSTIVCRMVSRYPAMWEFWK